MPKDVFKDGIITNEEIAKSFGNYFQNVNSLINQYEFGCLHHEDFRDNGVTRKEGFNIHGFGFTDKDPNMYHYNLSSAILWVTKCKCGREGVVGFMMSYNTAEWSEIKKKLDKEKVSELDLYRTRLAPTSKIEFVHFAPFRKKRKLPSISHLYKKKKPNEKPKHWWYPNHELDDYLQ